MRNGEPIPPIGEWLVYKGKIVPCQSGLHASKEPFDALQYAPGPMLHKVSLVGDLVPHGNPVDKHVGRKRKIIASIDATHPLRKFARQCALDVIHLWDAPKVIKEYLETGNEKLRAAAQAAAWDAARDAAWDAARAAARAAAQAAARDAARDAAWDAARAAAWDAAQAAAWDAARDAAWDAQRTKFNAVIKTAFSN